MIKGRFLFGLVSILASFSIGAATCHQVQTAVCVDSTPSKQIGGFDVSVGEIGGCWKYEEKFECIAPNYVDYCAAISKSPGCWQSSSVCSEKAWNGECIRYTQTYRCDNPNSPLPANTIQLDSTYTVTKDTVNTTQCDPYSTSNRCTLASHTCIEGPETRIIDRVSIYKSCWRYQDDYSCVTPNMTSECGDLYKKEGCTEISSRCIENDATLGCIAQERSFSCVTKSGTSHTELNCSVSMSCTTDPSTGKETCWDSGHPNDKDFGRAIATLEAAREMSEYANAGIFKGEKFGCRKGYGGLKNCCDEKVQAAQNNNQVLSNVATEAGMGAVKMGSKFVFDYMYANTEWVKAATDTMAGVFGSASSGGLTGGFSMYGLSYGGTYGALAAGSSTTGMFGQTIYGLGNGFAFDPYTLVIMIVIMVIMKLMECNEEEQKLGMYRGSDLCHYVGSYCSQKALKVCVESTQTYCCFNSKLARIIQEQGRPQIGKSWGNPESPNCAPLSIDEIQQIDFSKIDFTEFVQDIMDAVVPPNPAETAEKARVLSTRMGGG